MFFVGQKVVCIDDYVGPNHTRFDSKGRLHLIVGDLDGLTKGLIYTIAKIYLNQFGIEVFDLIEIIRKPERDVQVDGFRSTRFRPLVETKTDISIFLTILHGCKHGKDNNMPLPEYIDADKAR